MRTELVLNENVRELLRRRGLSQRDLADWMGHHETWLSKILKEERGLKLKEVDRMADFFGMKSYQLLAPGIGPLTERRRGDRRSGRERRGDQDRRKPDPSKATQPRLVGRGRSKKTLLLDA